MQRRTFLLGGGAAVVLAAGAAAAWWQPAWQGDRLSPSARAVWRAVALGVLDGTLPRDDAARAVTVDAHLDRLTGTLAGLAPATRQEVSDLIAVLAFPPGRRGLAGLATPWEQATAAEVQAMLADLRHARLAVRQQVYHALRDLTNAAYYADPGTWRALGYPGPRDIGA